MKTSLIAFFALLFFAACSKKDTDNQTLKLSETNITIDAEGGVKEVLIAASETWRITNIPDWCSVDETTGNSHFAIRLSIDPNETYLNREAVLKITDTRTVCYLSITQSGLEKSNSLEWFSFPVNSFSSVEKVSEKTYAFKADKLFVNSNIVDKIYPGKLLSSRLETYNQLVTYENYTLNPITISALGNGKVYIETLIPSKAGTDSMVQKIIANLPKQSSSFGHRGPLIYTSAAQLYLLSFGNLGIDIGKLLKNEMGKNIGMIYAYSLTVFDLIIDLPENLIDNGSVIDELTKEHLSYISTVDYGRMGLLIIETDDKSSLVNGIVRKILNDQALSSEEAVIMNRLNIYYISFAKNNKLVIESGKEAVIKKYAQGMTTNDIIPLSYSIGKYKNNSMEVIQYQLVLP